MPSTTLTEALKEAYACAPSNVVVLETLEISHPLLEEPVYLVRDRQDRALTLETSDVVVFVACGFNMSLPAAGDNGLQELQLSIDNVDRQISDFLESAKDFTEPVRVVYRPYLSTDLTQPQLNPPLVLFLSDVSVNLTDVTAKATFANLLNKNFPTQLYTRSRFPSLGQ